MLVEMWGGKQGGCGNGPVNAKLHFLGARPKTSQQLSNRADRREA